MKVNEYDTQGNLVATHETNEAGFFPEPLNLTVGQELVKVNDDGTEGVRIPVHVTAPVPGLWA